MKLAQVASGGQAWNFEELTEEANVSIKEETSMMNSDDEENVAITPVCCNGESSKMEGNNDDVKTIDEEDATVDSNGANFDAENASPGKYFNLVRFCQLRARSGPSRI
jgi:hypothetical protein